MDWRAFMTGTCADLFVDHFERGLLHHVAAHHVRGRGRQKHHVAAHRAGCEQPEERILGERLGAHRWRFGHVGGQRLEERRPLGAWPTDDFVARTFAADIFMGRDG